jgi:probable phosphoglycerate mutase
MNDLDPRREPPRIVLVRHAQTAWSVTGQHTGTTDVPLTDDGRALTPALRPRLADRTFGLVLTSPLRRAMDTAALAGHADAIVVDDLREWDYGDYEGRTTAEVHAERRGWDLWVDGAPNGESPAEVTVRTDRVVERLVRAHDEGNDALVFGHGHALRALAVRWLGLRIVEGRRLVLGTASVSVLTTKRDLRVLERWNDRSHLPDPD